MEGEKIRILAIAPYEGMERVMERAAQGYSNVQMDIYTGNLDEGVSIVKQMPTHTYDCIISRGGTAAMIRQMTELPVVEIWLSLHKILNTMKVAENYSDLYAIVGFPSITEPAHTLCNLLGYDRDIRTVHGKEEVPVVLEQLKEEGYHMVVCDMIAHTLARQLGMDAFLITSGVEELRTAIEQAVSISMWMRKLRQENMFLRGAVQEQNGKIVVMGMDGSVYYSVPFHLPTGMAKALQEKIKEVPAAGTAKMYHTERDQMYKITARSLDIDGKRYCLFYCEQFRIPLRSHWRKGVHTMNRLECECLSMNSFYSIVNAMGHLADPIRAISTSRQPVMITGETGTGKEHIARSLYLQGPLANKPFVTIHCEGMNDRSWDSLFSNDSSPFNALESTIYFQNFEKIPQERMWELLAVIQESDLSWRTRLIFSCVCLDGEQLSPPVRQFVARMGCLLFALPSLRSRADEIPSLANLYLNSLKLELGRQISGFEPNAMEMLYRYDWPNNYTQFQYVIQTLATLTESGYIRSSAVAELLTKERSRYRKSVTAAMSVHIDSTLEEIIRDVILQAVDANHGNRAQAARQLGISRTTLWRYLNRKSER